MPDALQDASRRTAVVCLLASAAFFTWWGAATVPAWPAALPYFGGLVAAWLLAAVGVHRGLSFGPGFAIGLAAMSIVSLLPLGLRAPVTAFLAAQVVLISALTLRAFADPAQTSWRHGGLSFAVGLGAPWLLLVGLLPGLDGGASLLGLGALSVGGVGALAAFRGRTWGLFAILAAVPMLLAVPEARLGGSLAPHDRAGELAALALTLATLPWLRPIAARLFARRR
ncbi:MAG: hypothetical protein AB8I08_28070 [Sandaracinaceae bacterium]